MAGTMMAILSRNFNTEIKECIGGRELKAEETDGKRCKRYKLSRKWVLIARTATVKEVKNLQDSPRSTTLKNGTILGPIDLTDCKPLDLDRFCSIYTQGKFDDLVKELLICQSYFSAWINHPPTVMNDEVTESDT
jgi:hypothetical protein